MKASDFIAESPGQLVPIHVEWGDEVSFVPFPLPPNWKFPIELWPLLGDAKHEIGKLEGLGRNLPNPTILLRPLEDREAITSSKLEGTYASPQELLLFELSPTQAKATSENRDDEREVLNYRFALRHGMDRNLPISLRLIQELHEQLLKGVRGSAKSPGSFRKMQVAIGASGRFIPPPPQRVMECLDQLERYIHVDASNYDPLVDCFLVHYQFETIHPFNDGNGRVGRLLLALMLQQKCRLSKPWLFMSDYFERHKNEYIARLYGISTKADWSGWIQFCLEATIAQATETISRCERLLQIRAEYIQKLNEIGGSVRLHQIVENVFYSPFVRIAALANLLGVSYPTAKADVERLADAGILSELPNVSPKTYYAPRVYRVAYERLE